MTPLYRLWYYFLGIFFLVCKFPCTCLYVIFDGLTGLSDRAESWCEDMRQRCLARLRPTVVRPNIRRIL